MTDEEESIFFCPLEIEMIPGDNEARYLLDACEDIVFLGYPNNIYDEVNNIPLIRKGITATPIYVDFNGKPEFVIDASVFPGSSGSPVLLCEYIDEKVGRRKINKVLRTRFLGILSRGFHYSKNNEIKQKEIPTKSQEYIESQEMLDLGVVIKTKVLHQMIRPPV